MFEQPPPRPVVRSRSSRRWLSNLLLLLIAFFLGLLARDRIGSGRTAEPRQLSARGDLAEDEKSTIALFEQASPSVVFITNIALRQERFTLDIFKIPLGTGSGFVWDTDGHIVTNFHVISQANQIEVTLADQSTWKAEVVGADPDKELAVLRIDAPAKLLRPIKIGASADLVVGQKVFAIGNPFGLDQTLTTGVIGGLGREIESMTRRPISGMIQTDAAINPGNSGGPLLDSSGRLIGINTAIYSPTRASVGIGFAVPVDIVNELVPQLIRYGRAIKPQLGVTLIGDGMLRIDGVAIAQVVPGSGADEAGLHGASRGALGDVIIAIEGRRIRNNQDLYRSLDGKKPGDVVEVTVLRNGRKRDVKVRMQASTG